MVSYTEPNMVAKNARRIWSASLLSCALLLVLLKNGSRIFDVSTLELDDECGAGESQNHVKESWDETRIPITSLSPSTLENVLKTLLIEAVSFAAFQGLSPVMAKAFFMLTTGRASKMSHMLRFFSRKRPIWFNFRGLERSKQWLRQLYRNRSRLSAASDYTHVLGENSEEGNDP
mmetsp:Transcript_10690/g.16374  ORF Transcript_10690/g.16374 Transcript_10690/m.16374 type:complete len:175 (-) Transcript_10690:2281-2805(-)